jgi:hypothetical protein
MTVWIVETQDEAGEWKPCSMFTSHELAEQRAYWCWQADYVTRIREYQPTEEE